MRQQILALLCAAGLVLADQAQEFTPKDMLSAPRPQPAIASPGGDHAVSVVDQWDPKEDRIHRAVYLVALNNTKQAPLALLNTSSAHASQFLWLDSSTLAYLNGTTLCSLSISSTQHELKPEKLLSFPSGVNPTGLQFNHKSGVLAFSGQVWAADGDLDHVGGLDAKWENRGDTALVYDELYVRHWDTWRTPGRVWTLGATHLDRKGAVWQAAKKGDKGQFINLLNGTNLYSRMDPISTFSLSAEHVAMAIKSPHLNMATHTREDIYLISLSSAKPYGQPKHLTPHAHGAISAVTFSPDGKKLAWLEMAKDGYESDRRVIVVQEAGKKAVRWTDEWDRSPNSLSWALDSESIYFTAEHHGRTLPYHLSHANHLPTPLLFDTSTVAITPISHRSILLTKQSITSPSEDFILTLPKQKRGKSDSESATMAEGDDDGDKLPRDNLRKVTSWAKDHLAGKMNGLDPEEFWFKGAEGKDVMGWAIRPRGLKEGQEKKWPLAFLIHGGPQGATQDIWSTRWNPAVFASHGYFVIAINPTGSTGYGQEFTDAIQNNWGGRPYKDLLAGYHAALDLYPEIDPNRTAAAGGSYGGYMINYINGHNDPFGFKALVCHDGVFDTVTTGMTTEELFFEIQEFGGTPLTHRANYEKWNPLNFAHEWTTPELVIQGGKDYRLENSQGLGAFTALQLQGVPSRFVYFDDENHWVLKPSNSLRWHYEVFRWLDEWVGPAKSGQDAMDQDSEAADMIDIGGRFVIQA
ncbi:hypothetical protein IAU60_003858 [Kwoniella sp. DSM 27419]